MSARLSAFASMTAAEAQSWLTTAGGLTPPDAARLAGMSGVALAAARAPELTARGLPTDSSERLVKVIAQAAARGPGTGPGAPEAQIGPEGAAAPPTSAPASAAIPSGIPGTTSGATHGLPAPASHSGPVLSPEDADFARRIVNLSRHDAALEASKRGGHVLPTWQPDTASQLASATLQQVQDWAVDRPGLSAEDAALLRVSGPALLQCTYATFTTMGMSEDGASRLYEAIAELTAPAALRTPVHTPAPSPPQRTPVPSPAPWPVQTTSHASDASATATRHVVPAPSAPTPSPAPAPAASTTAPSSSPGPAPAPVPPTSTPVTSRAAQLPAAEPPKWAGPSILSQRVKGPSTPATPPPQPPSAPTRPSVPSKEAVNAAIIAAPNVRMLPLTRSCAVPPCHRRRLYVCCFIPSGAAV